MISNDKVYDICIVGLGPAGIGAALSLAKSSSNSSIICIEAGSSHRSRSCGVLQYGHCMDENPCSIISGFGGCSLLSSGKVSDFPAGSALSSILKSEEQARHSMARALELLGNYISLHKPSRTVKDIEYAAHYYHNLGFEFKYYDVYRFIEEELSIAYDNIYSELISAGIKVGFNTRVTRIFKEDNGFTLLSESRW